MKKRKGNLEILIIATVIILSIVYIIFRKSDRVHYKVPVLQNIKSDEIMKIILTKSDRIVALENRKGGWVVGEEAYKAEDPLVQKIIENVAALKLTTLVSKAGNYFKYELDEDKKINVKVFNQKKIIREFDTGKPASTNDHTNIRLKDDKNVYHANGSLKSDLDKSVDDLRDKKVFSFEKNSISEILFTINGEDFKVNKVVLPLKQTGGDTDSQKGEEPEAETEWQSAGNKIDASKLDPALNILSDLKCDTFLYSETDLEGSEMLFSIKLSGNAVNDIKVYRTAKKEDDQYIGETSQTKYKFFIKKYRVENFLNPLKELFGLKTEN